MKFKIQFTDVLHIVACMLCAFQISVIIALTTPDPTPCIVGGFISAMMLGIGKEYGDYKNPNNSFSWSDILADFIGSVIGCLGGFTALLIHI